jgi:adenylate cyclase
MPSSANDNDSWSGFAEPRPDAAEVKAELARVLGSRCFEQAGRSSDFLKFVVEEALAGHGERLKGYTIALEVFGRPPDFDAQSDPLVRVEAGRLRRRLMEYYVAEGHANPVRIDMPRGRYEPAFDYAAGSGPTARTKPLQPPQRGSRGRWRYVAGAAVAIAGALVWLAVDYSSRDAGRDSDAASVATPSSLERPRVMVQAFENLTSDPTLDYLAAGITEEIMLRLNDANVAVIAGDPAGAALPVAAAGSATAAGSPTTAGPTQPAQDEPLAAYLLTGSVRNAADRIRISARLVQRDSGAQLWTSAYDENLTISALLAIEEKIAAQVTTTIAAVYGPIFQQELARAARKPPAQLETYDCVLKYYAYRRSVNPNQHRTTLQCFQQAVTREPKFADAWAGLALMYLDEYGFGYNPQPGPVGPLDRAREAARTALDIDGESLLANFALARVRFMEGDLDGFARSTERVAALGSTNVEALATIGAFWVLAGFPERGTPLLEKADALGPRLATSTIARAATDIRAGRYDDALGEMLRLDLPNWVLTPVLVAATAGLAGREDVAQRAAVRVREMDPTFADHARAALSKWHLDEPLLDALLRGLRAAGLDVD